MAATPPSYLKLAKNEGLASRIRTTREYLSDCTLCPRKCRVDRLGGQTGICKTGASAWVSSYSPHYGEESPLVGMNGSGTIFFTHCNLMCTFCQNYDISHQGVGQEVTDRQLAAMMVELQKLGCHNINFVTPSHVIPQILEALSIAVKDGLQVPLVYNSSGYDSIETLNLVEGVFDIYMPDFKFWDSKISQTTCNAADYPAIARSAIKEMHRQVGDLVIDANGVAEKGLLIRHLILPRGLAGTRDIMHFIAHEISPDTYVNIMSQYRPCGRAAEMRELAERPTGAEYSEALKVAAEEGIWRFDRPRRVFWVH